METYEFEATTWTHKQHFDEMRTTQVTIHKMNSPFYDGIKYTVRQVGHCLNKDGEWEYEPMPSDRDDAFYKRCRFDTFEEAVEAVRGKDRFQNSYVGR